MYVGTKEKQLYMTPPDINNNCYCQFNFSKFSHPVFCDDRNRSHFDISYIILSLNTACCKQSKQWTVPNV